MTAFAAFTATGEERRHSRTHLGIRDLVEGLRLSWLWTALAQQDIKLRYRGSILGPFWQTATTALMIGGLGVIYPHLFKVSTAEYFPLLSTGLIFWSFVSMMIIEGCGTFTEVGHIVHVVKLPFSVHAYRVVYRNILTLAHNLVIIPIVLVIFPPPLEWARLLLLVPAFLLVSFNGVWITLLFGMFSARYRDVPPIVASIVQLLLFVTPIFWQYQQLGPSGWWVQLSPIFAAIDIMRAPLMGVSAGPYSWGIISITTIVGWGGTFLLFSRLRHRLPFWV
jgi:homopolymeric O-antigen transport system permease protein